MRMTDLPIFARPEDACACVNLEPTAKRGRITRTNTVHGGKHGKGDGALVLFPDGKGGLAHNWQTGAQAFFFADYNGERPSREELRKLRAELRKQRAKYERETAERQKAVSVLAGRILAETETPADEHEYLRRKCLQIESYWRGLRCISIAKAQELINQAAIKQEDDSNQVLRGSGRLFVVPLSDAAGAVWSVQFIDEAGKKTFLKGGRKKGLLWCPDGLSLDAGADGVIGIAEGVATAMSVTKLYGVPCVAAIDAGNLSPAAETMRERFPNHALAFYADRDPSAVGEEKAREAALMLQGRGAQCSVLLPPFAPEIESAFIERTGKAPTDFNDYWMIWSELDD